MTTATASGQLDANGVLPVAGDKNYPWKTRTESTYDVSLEDGTSDETYMSLLHDWLPRLFERHRPQLLFFQAGVDAMVNDSFGR